MPADPGEVARNQAEQNAAAGQAIKHRFDSRAVPVADLRANPQVVALGGTLDFGQRLANCRARRSRAAQHHRQDVRVEHALHRNSFSGGIEAGDSPDSFHQRLPMVWPRAADQRPIDIEEHQRAKGHGRIAIIAGIDFFPGRYNGLVAFSRFRIGLIQMACSVDPNENLAKAEWRIREAASKGAKIVCLQELFRSQYFCREERSDLFDLAETVPGSTTEIFMRLARECQIVIVVPIFERRAAGLYHNSAVVIDADGTLLGLYRKMHIPDDPQFFEKFYFTPGDLGVRVFATRYARVAPLICWDQWFPEAARMAAMSGADVLFYPTAIGWNAEDKSTIGPSQHDAWKTIQRAHAIANGVFVAVVNRVGHEGPPDAGLEFWGGSFVADPFGVVMAEASHSDEQIILADCDTRQIEEVRRNWPFFRDRRIDAYGPILERMID